MNSPETALLALILGGVLGGGLVWLLIWAYRQREEAAQSRAAVPTGVSEVIDAMDDPACIVDHSGVVLAASPPAVRFGVEVGLPLENPELRQLVRTSRQTATAATETLRISRGGMRLDPRLVAARATTLSERVTLLIVRDVTERERLDEMRNDFVANTSHELKTPVGAISLLAEAIESAADDANQVRAFAVRISAEATRLAQLTGRIMSLSRLQVAGALADVGPVSIDEVVAASIEAHAVQASGAEVSLVRGGDRGTWVRGDAQILVEAVGNLVANAIAYSPKGSRVGVGISADAEVVEIAVADQGIGIAEGDRDRIFERFYRADEARSRRTGGTGLGLSIVKHATQRHGGEVRLWSRPGKGSTFTVRLPRIDAPDLEDRGKKRMEKRARKAAKAALKARARNGGIA